MKRLFLIIFLLPVLLCGCSEETASAVVSAAATAGEEVVKNIVENIDWEELKGYIEEGAEALTEEYPALKQENIRKFIKNNGLKLISKYLESSDEGMQENARKLGQIIKILDPELTDEVDAVLTE